jgi:hypothetical protein
VTTACVSTFSNGLDANADGGLLNLICRACERERACARGLCCVCVCVCVPAAVRVGRCEPCKRQVRGDAPLHGDAMRCRMEDHGACVPHWVPPCSLRTLRQRLVASNAAFWTTAPHGPHAQLSRASFVCTHAVDW